MKRCAVYTRKSTEEGLEQDFNSLQAQREACEAYIRSQKHDGWKLVRTRFDDGGHSGGTIDRPALQTLMEAIDRNEVDVVVVYKVDRLTRSLADFAKIIERFDARGVSFVSVTQQFNTTSSMGRLTLNVLLSFAQFEREVTAERIRDKIAASKKKGMWMGGPPPLGYDSIDKKLEVNDKEAETVRTLYRIYVELGTVRALLRDANRLGIMTKPRVDRHGRITGGKPFSRGNLYQLLRNPLYVGRIPHKGETYPGQHQPIVDEDLWQEVQARLDQKAITRRSNTNARSPALLAGLIFDETGDLLCPTHASKAGRRYRYYVSKRLVHDADLADGWRLRAEVIEGCVIQVLTRFLRDQHRIADATTVTSPVGLRSAIGQAEKLAYLLEGDQTADKVGAIRGLMSRIDLRPNLVTVICRRQALCTLLGLPDSSEDTSPHIELAEPVNLRRRGVETKLVLQRDGEAEAAVDESLCRLIANARRWFDDLASGDAHSIRSLAHREKVSESEITRALPLAFLAPDIIQAILDGRQPGDMTATSLRRIRNLPADWAEQRRVLGF